MSTSRYTGTAAEPDEADAEEEPPESSVRKTDFAEVLEEKEAAAEVVQTWLPLEPSELKRLLGP